MSESIIELPDNIRRHLEQVTTTSGLPNTKESYEKIAKNWMEKKKMFEEQIKSLDMIEIDSMDKEDKRASLMLTYSGSLISMGPLFDEDRWVEYASIKLRNNVPDIVKVDNTHLLKSISINQCAEFREGPIKSTSFLLKIAVCKEDVKIEEQEKRVREATIFLTNGFVKINRTIIGHDINACDQFNMRSIISYIAAKNNISQKQTKHIIEDYLSVLESGVLLGARVPLGKIGKLFLKKKAPQKARVGINPSSGEKITIKSKPEMFVPKISFSKSLKEKSTNIELGERKE